MNRSFHETPTRPGRTDRAATARRGLWWRNTCLLLSVGMLLASHALAAPTPEPSGWQLEAADYILHAKENRYLVKGNEAWKPAPNMEPRMVHCEQIARTWKKMQAAGYCATEPPGELLESCKLRKPVNAPGCKRPNILIFLVDDMGWSDFGAFGGGSAFGAVTPNIDRLASQGLLLTSAYAQPTCSPTRATIHTGQLPIHHGVLSPPMYGDPGGLTPESVPLPHLLKQQGYVTHGVGKWHLGNGIKNLPSVLGYDEYFGFLNVSDMYSEWRDPYYNPEVRWDAERTAFMQKIGFNHFNMRAEAGKLKTGEPPCENLAEITLPREALDQETPTVGNGQPCTTPPDRASARISISELDNVWAEDSVAFIHRMAQRSATERAQNPWFLYHATRGCHFDNYPREAFKRKSYARTDYGDCTVEIDSILGRVVAALETTGQAQDTFIFLTSDNGPEQEIDPHGHTPFRGGKGDTWEGGMRVPAIAWWPGMIQPGRRSDGLFDLADLYTTALNMAGLDYAVAAKSNPRLADRYLYGIDQTTFLVDDAGSSNRRSVLYWLMTTFSAVRMDEFKLYQSVSIPTGLRQGNVGGLSGSNQDLSYFWLFNLQNDPVEQKNVLIRHLWNQGLFTQELHRFFCVLTDYPPNLPTEPGRNLLYDQILDDIKDHSSSCPSG